MAVVCSLAVAMMSVAIAKPVLQESISGDVLLSGEANERLEDIGRRAAKQDLAIQVNAPDIWESEIVTPLRRGAGDTRIEVKFVNTLRDTVVIRGVKAGEDEDPLETLKRITNNAKARSLQGDEPPEEEAEPAQSNTTQSDTRSSSRPDIDRPATDVPEVRVERPKAELPTSDTYRSSHRAREDRAEKEPVETPEPEPPEVPDTPSPEAAEAPAASGDLADQGGAAEEKQRFERLYNDGRAIRRSLSADELKRDDLVFAGDHHNVVVREGISTTVYWLDGPLPEDRIEHEERNRYAVTANAAAPTPEPAAEEAPPGEEAERERFERLYNQGREITSTMDAGDLRRGDELYEGDSVTVVLRRSRVNVEAYWLSDSVDLDQDAIEHEAKNKYVVVSDLK